MDRAVTIQKVDGGCGVVLPQDVLHRLGWKEGDVVELHSDDTGLELFAPKAIADEDFQRQMSPARTAMRKYYAALKELGKH